MQLIATEQLIERQPQGAIWDWGRVASSQLREQEDMGAGCVRLRVTGEALILV